MENINKILAEMGKKNVIESEDLSASGLLDSIELIDFFISVEKEFGIKIPESDINEFQLAKIKNLIEYINKHK